MTALHVITLLLAAAAALLTAAGARFASFRLQFIGAACAAAAVLPALMLGTGWDTLLAAALGLVILSRIPCRRRSS